MSQIRLPMRKTMREIFMREIHWVMPLGQHPRGVMDAGTVVAEAEW